jgi:Fe-S-cluster containining protein
MSECSCKACQQACQYKPGWFAPGEAEVVAAAKGLTLKELFDRELMVDWFENHDAPIFVLSPAIVGASPGEEFPVNPKGQCVYYENGRCSIHAVKPFECAKSMCTDESERARSLHQEVAKMWDNEKDQQQVQDLLGRRPEATEYSFLESFLW